MYDAEYFAFNVEFRGIRLDDIVNEKIMEREKDPNHSTGYDIGNQFDVVDAHKRRLALEEIAKNIEANGNYHDTNECRQIVKQDGLKAMVKIA